MLDVYTDKLLETLKKNHEVIKTLTFCNNCRNANDCYMCSVFSFIGLSTGYCAAGIPKTEPSYADVEELIKQLSNHDLTNHDSIVANATHMIRHQNRILKRKTNCADCTNHGECDAEDIMKNKNIANPYCCVGGVKEK